MPPRRSPVAFQPWSVGVARNQLSLYEIRKELGDSLSLREPSK